jgi:tetratricopeptide (TPR) repeat protein
VTLVLTLASEHDVHMTCDFKLTDARTHIQISVDAHKLIQVGRPTFQAIVGVTGFAVLDRIPIGTWVAQRTSQLRRDATLDELLAVLRGASEPLARVRFRDRKHRHLTFVVGAIQGSQSVICVLSNFQNLRGTFLADGEIPGHELSLDVVRPSRAQLFLAGGGGSLVTKEEKNLLERLLRSGVPPKRIQEEMAKLNEQVAGRTDTVSRGCYAATQLATGHGQTQPFLVEQVGDFNPPEFEELFKLFGLTLNPATLPDGSPAPIQMTSSSSVTYSPSPQFFHEQFKLRPDDTELWNNFGVYEQEHGRIDKAIEAYEKALKIDTENYNAAHNLANMIWAAQGDRARAIELFSIALKNPDTTRRRETLALRADWAAFTDRDIEAARSFFAEALDGELLPNASALWTRMVLVFDPPECLGPIEPVLDEILRTAPRHVITTTVKAMCMWWLHGDIGAAKSILLAALGDLPKNSSLLSTCVHVSLADGDLDLAESLLSRLAKVVGTEDSQELLSYRVIVGVCRGRSLSEAESLLQGVARLENLVSLATLLWAHDRDAECADVVGRVSTESLSYQGRVELDVIQRLLGSRSDVSSDCADLAGHLLDPTMLRAIAAHGELSESRRYRLNAVLDVVCPAT